MIALDLHYRPFQYFRLDCRRTRNALFTSPGHFLLRRSRQRECHSYTASPRDCACARDHFLVSFLSSCPGLNLWPEEADNSSATSRLPSPCSSASCQVWLLGRESLSPFHAR